MTELIPAILTKDYEDMKNKISLVRGHVPLVQIDLCDGIFVPSQTWPFASGGNDDYHFQAIMNEQEGLPFWEDIDFELDMMVADAMENFDVYMKLGPKRMVFHIEAFSDLGKFKDFLEGIDPYIRDSLKIGVAINPTTPLENLYPLISHIDFVQCMAIARIGYQGEPFYEPALEVISTLREKYPELPISIDGGVNLQTGQKLVDAGATELCANSALFNSGDIIGTIEKFRSL